MFNLKTVVKFEVIRAVKKPSFWILIFAIPVIYLAFFGIGYLSGKATREQEQKQANEKISFEIVDKSGVVSKEIVESVGGKIVKDKNAAIEKVKKKEIDVAYVLPEKLESETVEVYANFVGVNEGGKYKAVFSAILKNSVNKSVDPNQIAVVNETYKVNETTFKDGKEYNPLAEMVIPGVFLVVFYFVVIFLSNRMLTSTTEEKENRVTEMILTSISAKTLIVGKIISILILGFIQISALILPILALYLLALNTNIVELPNVLPFLESLKFDGVRVALGAIILIFGFLMVTGMIIALGAAMPTAQEASNYFGLIVMFLMSPFVVMHLFTSPEKSIFLDIVTYFPLTSPISLLLRNTLGTLSVFEAIIGVGLLIAFTIAAVLVAVRIFQYGTISYGSKVKLKSLFAKKA